jgi:menaquinone-specific isochorismate synthase
VTSITTPALPRFVARTEPVEDPGDLLAFADPRGFVWLNDGGGFVTTGLAAEVPAPMAADVLGAVTHRRAPGAPEAAGPRLVGALPFEGGGHLVLPSRILGRDANGRAWRTTIDDSDVPPALHMTGPTPDRLTVRRCSGPDAWHDIVQRALAVIRTGGARKIVLARDIEVDADAPFDVVDVLSALRATQPGCTVYGHDGFIGASPELLLRRHGRSVRSRPMAGTGDDPDALLASAKDAHEHRIVVDAIAAELGDLCSDLRISGPRAMRFASVTHLATTIDGTIDGELTDSGLDALGLALRLHPTPAVAGSPTDAARAMIRTLEGRTRGRYAGPCGWMDAQGNGEFIVALRCAEVRGSHARLYAGAGIVDGSEPAAEWAETQAKLQPMLRALVRP